MIEVVLILELLQTAVVLGAVAVVAGAVISARARVSSARRGRGDGE